MTDPDFSFRRALRNFEDRTPPESPEPIKCTACEHGKIGCTLECADGSDESDAICQREHNCPMKCEEGWIVLTERDINDAKGETDMNRYCERD